jgi:hypothetical protein
VNGIRGLNPIEWIMETNLMQAVDVRGELADALKLDLVGPSERLGSPTEILPQAPSRWYLTGFLAPLDADRSQKVDEDGTDTVDAISDAGGADDATTPEPASARQSYMPSSTGLSILIGGTTKKLKIKVRWGDYKLRKPAERHAVQEEWERQQHEQELTIDIPKKNQEPARDRDSRQRRPQGRLICPPSRKRRGRRQLA